MNRNTLIGFSLIAVVLILFSYLNTPSQEQIDAYNHQQDSIAAVKQQQAAQSAQGYRMARNGIGGNAAV